MLLNPSSRLENHQVTFDFINPIQVSPFRVQGINMRREVITSYSKNDLLDLHRNEPCVLQSVMKSPYRRVKEAAARLVNILTLDYSGRSYLLGSDKLVIMLIESLKSEVQFY